MKLTPHEQKVLDLIKKYPEIVEDNIKRSEIAEANGMSEKTLRNRIGDLKKYGVLAGNYELIMSDNNSNIIDIIRTLWGVRIRIIYNVIIAGILSIILALILPITFSASAIIMPPVSDNSLGLSSALSSMPLGGLFQVGGDSEANTFLAILKSRKVMEDVIDQFDLVDFYDAKYREQALEGLRNNTSFTVEEEGVITVAVSAKTSWFHSDKEEEFCKKLVSDMANYFVKKLDEVNKGLKGEKARLHRGFIESRYDLNIRDLRLAEDSLNVFQNKHNTIALPEQTKAAIEVVAALKAQVFTTEIKYGIMKQSLSVDHPDLRNLKKEITELKRQIDSMNYGKDRDYLFPKFSEIPDLGAELTRLIRLVEIKNTIHVFLTQQYEEAKIQEARDTPTLQVLDAATIPEKKSKPARALIVIFYTFFTGVFSVLYYLSKPTFINIGDIIKSR